MHRTSRGVAAACAAAAALLLAACGTISGGRAHTQLHFHSNEPGEPMLVAQAAAPQQSAEPAPPRRKRMGPPKDHPGPRRLTDYIPQEPLPMAAHGLDGGEDGHDFGFEAVPGTGWVPPDADLAVGLNHIVAVVNGQIALFDKQGNNLSRQNMAGAQGFWAAQGAGGWVFDPETHYDEHEHRYWIVACEQNGSASFYNLAVSAGSDPTGPWHKYRIDVTSRAGRDIDSPNLSIGRDSIYLAADFSEGTGDRMLISIFPKASFLAGEPAPLGQHLLVPGLRAASFATRPAGPAPQFMVEARLTSQLNNTVVLHTVRSGTSGVQHASIAIEVPSYLQPGFPPQPGTTVSPDLYDARFWNSAASNGSIWASHNVRTPTTGDRTVVRWYEFRAGDPAWPAPGTTPPALAQWGEIDPGAGIHTFCPSIAADRFGNVAISFARSSSTEFISYWRAIRRAGDPAGTLREPQLVRASTAAFTVLPRWGDYSGTVVDPADACTFWGHNQFTTSGHDWRTWIARYSIRPEADLDGNCRVDILDFMTMQKWFMAGDMRADLDGNGMLDANDFIYLISRATDLK
jgi:hypothetical protein